MVVQPTGTVTLFDIEMPNIDSLEAAKQLTEAGLRRPVVVIGLSARGVDSDADSETQRTHTNHRRNCERSEDRCSIPVRRLDSSERLNDLTVRVRSLLANSAATGFINRMKPKSSPSAM